MADSGQKPPDDDGTEPDPRFTFANERTFLAWSRTALALVVAGLGVVQLLPPFPGVPWGRHVLGVPLDEVVEAAGSAPPSSVSLVPSVFRRSPASKSARSAL